MTQPKPPALEQLLEQATDLGASLKYLEQKQLEWIKLLESLPEVEDSEEKLRHLREMCIEREGKINGEWGDGNATDEQLAKEIDDELFVRMTRKRIE